MSTRRERILAHDDWKSELVVVPEWGDVDIELRSVNVEDRGKLVRLLDADAAGVVRGDLDAVQVFCLTASAYDPETGKRMFSASDAAALKKKNPEVLDRLMAITMRLSGVSKEAVEEAKNE